MKRNLAAAAVLFLLMAGTLMSFGIAYGQDGGQIDFSVKAVLPDNQADSGATYFDLRMEPGQKQDLSVRVTNDAEYPIEVEVSAVSASTNGNGIIDYQTPNIRDETLQIPFSDIATVRDQGVITVPPLSSVDAVISIAMPDWEYDGVLLGGLVFAKKDDGATGTSEQRAEGASIAITNKYSYVIGVKLEETDAVVSPDFVPVTATPELVNYRVGVTHYLRNQEAAIVKDMQVDVAVYKQGQDEAVKTAHAEGLNVAPNSVLPFAVAWDGLLDPGSYVSHVSLQASGQQWSFEMPFEVDSGSAAAVNAGSVETQPEMPWWSFALMALLALLIVLAIVLLIVQARKRRKTLPR